MTRGLLSSLLSARPVDQMQHSPSGLRHDEVQTWTNAVIEEFVDIVIERLPVSRPEESVVEACLN
jgi:hypothetical protein